MTSSNKNEFVRHRYAGLHSQVAERRAVTPGERVIDRRSGRVTAAGLDEVTGTYAENVMSEDAEKVTSRHTQQVPGSSVAQEESRGEVLATGSYHTKTADAKSGADEAHSAKSSAAKSSAAKSSAAKSSADKPGVTNSGTTKSSARKSSAEKSSVTPPGAAKPGAAKPGAAKSSSAKPSGGKSTAVKSTADSTRTFPPGDRSAARKRRALNGKSGNESTESDSAALAGTDYCRTAIACCVKEELVRYFDMLDGEPPSGLYRLVIRQAEHALLRMVMQECNGNQSRAAEWLGISRGNLRAKLAEMGQ